MGVVLKGTPFGGKNKNLINFLSVRPRVTLPHQSPQRHRHTQWLSLLTAVQMQTETPSPRHWEWPGGCYSMAASPPSCHPAHSLSSMPLIVLGRGGPFLLTALVLLSLQGPALRTWNCWESFGCHPWRRSFHLQPHASPPSTTAPIKAGLRGRVVTESDDTDARGEGVHWRRGLCLLQTGRGLLVSILLFSLLWGEHILMRLTRMMWPIPMHLMFFQCSK